MRFGENRRGVMILNSVAGVRRSSLYEAVSVLDYRLGTR